MRERERRRERCLGASSCGGPGPRGSSSDSQRDVSDLEFFISHCNRKMPLPLPLTLTLTSRKLIADLDLHTHTDAHTHTEGERH